jgi:hypothetical protein
MKGRVVQAYPPASQRRNRRHGRNLGKSTCLNGDHDANGSGLEACAQPCIASAGDMKIGVIGASQIGGTLTRRFTALKHEAFVANSRGPQTLVDRAAETGATAVSVTQAARETSRHRHSRGERPYLLRQVAADPLPST